MKIPTSPALQVDFYDLLDRMHRPAAAGLFRSMKRYDGLPSRGNVEYIAGGATQNCIRVAQWMLQVPGATSYMGCIWKAKFGEEMKKIAQPAGVNG